MFDELTDEQKALLARALNTELNSITKSYIRAASSSLPNAMKEIFKHQHAVVYEMWDAIYPYGPDPDAVDEDLKNRLILQG